MIVNLQREADAWEPIMEGEAEVDEDGRRIGRNVDSLLAKAREEHAEVHRKNQYVETQMAKLRFEKDKRNRVKDLEMFDNDPMFGNYIPEFYKSQEYKDDTSMHPELKKMLYSGFEEGRDQRFEINNKEDALMFEETRQAAINYYKAKEQFLDDAFENQLTMTTKDFDEKSELYSI